MPAAKRSTATRQAQRNKARKSGTVERQRLSYDDRRAQFIDTARAIFIEKGLQGTTTRDIAEEVGVTDALIYNYFESKTDLFNAAILEPLESLLSELIEAGAGYAEIDPDTRISLSHVVHRGILESMLEITPLLIVALSSDQTSDGSFYRERLAPLVDKFAEGLDRNLAGWPNPTVAPDQLAKILLGTYVWTAIDAKFRGTELDIATVADPVAEFFIRGMTGEPSASADSPETSAG